MDRYHVGDRLVLGERGGNAIPAGRAEARRPDGSMLTRDWDRGPVRLRLDQPGTWHWRLYIREGARTSMEEGDVEVLPADASRRPWSRFLRRRS